MPKLILFVAYKVVPVEIINNLLVDQKLKGVADENKEIGQYCLKVDRSPTLFKTMNIADTFLNLGSIYLAAVKQFCQY